MAIQFPAISPTDKIEDSIDKLIQTIAANRKADQDTAVQSLQMQVLQNQLMEVSRKRAMETDIGNMYKNASVAPALPPAPAGATGLPVKSTLPPINQIPVEGPVSTGIPTPIVTPSPEVGSALSTLPGYLKSDGVLPGSANVVPYRPIEEEMGAEPAAIPTAASLDVPAGMTKYVGPEGQSMVISVPKEGYTPPPGWYPAVAEAEPTPAAPAVRRGPNHGDIYNKLMEHGYYKEASEYQDAVAKRMKTVGDTLLDAAKVGSGYFKAVFPQIQEMFPDMLHGAKPEDFTFNKDRNVVQIPVKGADGQPTGDIVVYDGNKMEIVKRDKPDKDAFDMITIHNTKTGATQRVSVTKGTNYTPPTGWTVGPEKETKTTEGDIKVALLTKYLKGTKLSPQEEVVLNIQDPYMKNAIQIVSNNLASINMTPDQMAGAAMDLAAKMKSGRLNLTPPVPAVPGTAPETPKSTSATKPTTIPKSSGDVNIDRANAAIVQITNSGIPVAEKQRRIAEIKKRLNDAGYQVK